MTRPLLLILLFVFFSLSSLSQDLSPVDSLRLFTTWKETADFLRTKDTIRLRTICFKSIDCTFCYGDDIVDDTEKPIAIFFKHGLDNLTSNKKLWRIIDTETPELLVSGYIDKNGKGERIYGIAYLFWKPNEYAKCHEGAQVVFNYVLRENVFKLISIVTIP